MPRKLVTLLGLAALGAVLIAADVSAGDRAAGRRLGEGGGAHEGHVWALAFSDNVRLLASSGDGDTFVWDVTHGTVARVVSARGAAVSMCFEERGDRLLAVSGAKEWKPSLATVDSRSVVRWTELDPGHEYCGGAYAVATISTSAKVLVACKDRAVYVLDTATQNVTTAQRWSFLPQDFSGNRLVVSPDGQSVLYKTINDAVGVFSLPGGERKLELPCRRGRLAAAFSQSSAELVLAGEETIQILDAQTGEERASFPIPLSGYVEGLWFTEGGKSVAAFLADGTLWTAEVKTGRTKRRQLGVKPLEAWPKRPYLSAIAVTPDGKTFAIAVDGDVRVFDTDTATERKFAQ